MKDPSPTLAQIQNDVDQWITTIGVRYFGELTNMALLTEEVGELARIMARRYGDQSLKPGASASAEDLAGEMADVLWVLVAMANQCDVDLSAAFAASMQKKTSRDADRHRSNPKLKP
jgi:NTP pyrophosphatase (non-canonical NTP hydrolase)